MCHKGKGGGGGLKRVGLIKMGSPPLFTALAKALVILCSIFVKFCFITPPPPLPSDTRLIDYTPRLFELSSTTGEFVASELLYPARGCDAEATPFFQSDLYTTHQPGVYATLVCVCVCCIRLAKCMFLQARLRATT